MEPILINKMIYREDIDFIEHLISRGKSFGSKNLKIAIESRNIAMIRCILNNMRGDNTSHIRRFSRIIYYMGDIEIIKAFDVSPPTSFKLRSSIHNGIDVEFIQYLVEEKSCCVELMDIVAAIRTGDIDIVRFLHSCIPNVDLSEKRSIIRAVLSEDEYMWDLIFGDRKMTSEFFSRLLHCYNLMIINIFVRDVFIHACRGRKYTIKEIWSIKLNNNELISGLFPRGYDFGYITFDEGRMCEKYLVMRLIMRYGFDRRFLKDIFCLGIQAVKYFCRDFDFKLLTREEIDCARQNEDIWKYIQKKMNIN